MTITLSRCHNAAWSIIHRYRYPSSTLPISLGDSIHKMNRANDAMIRESSRSVQQSVNPLSLQVGRRTIGTLKPQSPISMTKTILHLAVVAFRTTLMRREISREDALTFFAILDKVSKIFSLIRDLVRFAKSLTFVMLPVSFVVIAVGFVKLPVTVPLAVREVALITIAVGIVLFAFAMRDRLGRRDVDDFALVHNAVRICYSK